MNLKEEISKTRSKEHINGIRYYIGDDSRKFSLLMMLFFDSTNEIINSRAAWIVGHCVDSHQKLIHPYLSKLVYNLKNKVHVAVRRNTLRILQDIDIPDDLIGEITDICFKYLESKEEPIAVKVFAMTILGNICIKIPELQNELILIINDQLPYASAGFKSRAKRVLKKLEHS